jgi:hypothetical protein
MHAKNLINNNDIFEKIKPYILNLENIKLFFEPKPQQVFSMLIPKARPPPKESKPFENKKEKTFVEPIKTNTDSQYFCPKQKDSLFWCYFIIKNGFSAYEYPGTTTFVNEKEMKFQCIEDLRKSKQQLKVKKIKNLREDVEDELANKERIGMKTFIALCIVNNINILFIHKKKCFELAVDDNEQVYVIHKKEENGRTKYYYEMDATKDDIEKYRKTFFIWENVDKPLKAPSAYKVEDLQNLCKILNIPLLPKKTKKELYDEILLLLI